MSRTLHFDFDFDFEFDRTMTRGRKKNLTIPPSRTLVQQRDYRARKANYIANLEERCRKAEEENIRLRKELDEAKAHLITPPLLHPETVSYTF
jgi:hypothetical protein